MAIRTKNRLIGAHMPTSGGLYSCLTTGHEIGCTAVQLFTCSPRQWSHPALRPEEIQKYLNAQEETGIEFTIAHDSYLINLAAPSEEILLKSKAAFESELERADALQIKWLVTHMGAHLNQGEDEALNRLAASLREIIEATDKRGFKVGIALETTAGQGTGLGWRFEHLARILADTGAHPRLGVCLDTCHVFVAGYDLRTSETYEETWAEFDRLIGYDTLKVIHANDAKKSLGSRVDRHEHIGKGEIGPEAFAILASDPRLTHAPIIVETPDSDTMHAVNVALLRQFASGASATIAVTVQLYGHYSEQFPSPLTVTVPRNSTVADLANSLSKLDDRLIGVAETSRFALREEYCDLTATLSEGDSIAVVPPVSGG